MAVKEYKIKLEWDDGAYFQMKAETEEGRNIVVIRTEENNHYLDTRAQIEAVCKIFFDKVLSKIGDEMVST